MTMVEPAEDLVGCDVEIHGLTNWSELNGWKARVTRVQGGRCFVEIPLMPSNLRRLSADAPLREGVLESPEAKRHCVERDWPPRLDATPKFEEQEHEEQKAHKHWRTSTGGSQELAPAPAAEEEDSGDDLLALKMHEPWCHLDGRSVFLNRLMRDESGSAAAGKASGCVNPFDQARSLHQPIQRSTFIATRC